MEDDLKDLLNNKKILKIKIDEEDFKNIAKNQKDKFVCDLSIKVNERNDIM